MIATSDFRTESGLPAALWIRRTCRFRTLCIAGVACALIALGCCPTAYAQQRGAIGGALDAGFGVVDGSLAATLGASAWYRLIPALAIGLDAGSTSISGGGEQHGTVVDGYSAAQAFIDGRAFPSSPVGLFARVSIGYARATLLSPSTGPLYETKRNELILELEAGPEVRIFFTPRSEAARPDVFLRARGGLTTMSDATYLNFGLALGFEG